MESRINGHTKLFALIGSPVGHSGSPAMHNYSFARRGIDAAYLAFDVPEERTADAIEALRTLHAGGFNVTMPCKTEAARLVDRLSPAAELIGACNTVVMEEDGTLTGHNTDGIGFVRNLKEHGVEVKGQRIVILGTGGAATAITVQAALDGAAQIAIFNRKGGSYSNERRRWRRSAGQCRDISRVYIEDIHNRDALKEAIAGSDLLVNATSLGMCPMEKETPVPAEYLHPGLAVRMWSIIPVRRACSGRQKKPDAGQWSTGPACCSGRVRKRSGCSPDRRCRRKKCGSGFSQSKDPRDQRGAVQIKKQTRQQGQVCIIYFSITRSTPSSSLEAVMRSAAFFTTGWAFAMATPSPAYSIMEISL